MNYTIDEVKQFLKDWGVVFKSMTDEKHSKGYYQACLDAYLFIDKKDMKNYTQDGLRRTLRDIASEFEAVVKQKKGDINDTKRAEMFRHIANNLIKTPTVGVQSQLF